MNNPEPNSRDPGSTANNMTTRPTSYGVDNRNIANGTGTRAGHIPNFDGRDIANALIRLVQDQFAITHATQISRRLLKQVASIIRRHALLLSGIFTTASLAVLLPSLAVVVVNAIGFTSGGVLAGSLAAAIQSHLYGALTAGIFSSLQAFGATAAVASPAVLVLGGVSLVVGTGLFGWWLYRRMGRSIDNDDDDDDYDRKDN